MSGDESAGSDLREWARVARGLADLVFDMDVIVGVFDNNFLAEHSCAGLELCREPLRCAVPIDGELASLDAVTLDDLRGHSLMLVRRGWDGDVDVLCGRIHRDYPDIKLVDLLQYRAEIFNRAANEELTLVTLPIWREVHPLLWTVPTDWNISVSYGLLYVPEPAGACGRVSKYRACSYRIRDLVL